MELIGTAMPSEHDSPFVGLRKFAISWGWVFAFVVLCLSLFFHAYSKKLLIRDELVLRHKRLLETRNCIIEEQNDLRHQINSQSDPLWIQLTLMKGLGLVPEGQQKILFHEE